MKFNAFNVAMLASSAVAFPTMDAFEKLAKLNARQIDAASPQGSGALPSNPPAFDAAAQLVDVSGEYAVSTNCCGTVLNEC